jgi:hypothetical protein
LVRVFAVVNIHLRRAREALLCPSEAAISDTRRSAPVQALASQYTDLDLDHIEPDGVFGNVWNSNRRSMRCARSWQAIVGLRCQELQCSDRQGRRGGVVKRHGEDEKANQGQRAPSRMVGKPPDRKPIRLFRVSNSGTGINKLGPGRRPVRSVLSHD